MKSNLNHRPGPRRDGMRLTAHASALAVALLLGSTATAPVYAAIIFSGDASAAVGILTIGNTATGGVTVNAGSVVDGATAQEPFSRILAGATASGNGSIAVDGAGSKLLITGPTNQPGLQLGEVGAGSLKITNGGLLSAQRVDAAGQSGSNATIEVIGAGSAINSASTFNFGGRGTATVTISAGGVVNAETSNVGSAAGSNGKLTITGAGSALNLFTGATPSFGRAFMNIGREHPGTVEVLAGGKLLIDAVSIGTDSSGMSIGGGGGAPSPGGSFANGVGHLLIDGTGSELRIKQSNPVTNVGRQGGTGFIDITNGGKLVTENMSTGSVSFVGRDAGGSGTVTVAGAGSEWQTGRRLRIGESSTPDTVPGGTGLVTVSDAAVIRSDLISLGTHGTLAGNGTVIGNITNKGTIAPGSSPGVLNVQGNINLDPSGLVRIEIAGTDITLGEYDQLNALDNVATSLLEGTIDLAGQIDVKLLNGYRPATGSFFDVFTALDIVDHNPLFDLPTTGGLAWAHSIVDLGNGREALRLSVTAVPEPSSIALLIAGGLVVILRRRCRQSASGAGSR